MKKLLMILMAFSLLTACKDKKEADAKKTETKSTDDYRSGDNLNSKEKEKKDKPENSINSSLWDIEDENKFITDCEITASENVGLSRAKEYCRCMLGKIKEMYSSYEIAEEKLNTISKEDLSKLASDCN